MENHGCRWAAMLGMALVCLMAGLGLTARDPAAQTTGGNGLKGQYYDNQNLTAPSLPAPTRP